MNARDTYSCLRRELAPVFATTTGPCANGCGHSARGSGVCIGCLSAELQELVPSVDWHAFVAAMIESRNRIINAELAIEGVER